VHVREGKFPGEFGTGWNNAAFWSGQVGAVHPIFEQVKLAAVTAARKHPTLVPQIDAEVQDGWKLGVCVCVCACVRASVRERQ
jgi:hypothetical protein